MGAKLIIRPALAAPFEVAVGNTATIGRTLENTVCLNFSPSVSRQHAIIRRVGAGIYQLIDLGSCNGTYVDGQRVVRPAPLVPGTRIRIADNELLLVEEAAPMSAENAQATVAVHLEEVAIEARPVALMVCDIRGFSTMSETVAGADLAQLLGAWFREAGNLVHTRGGIIDKFMGDALLAYWGSGESGAADCMAAIEVARELRLLAPTRAWPNGDPFQICLALHYGEVTCSNVGLTAERDATIIGDAVNTVFRLESESKTLGQPLILSGAFAAQLPEDTVMTDCGFRALKGKSQTIRVFALEE